MMLNEPAEADEAVEQDGELDENRLNLTISNRKEYFDLLFDLLNLGLDRVTSAVWNLLV
jgi:hypothetical protein